MTGPQFDSPYEVELPDPDPSSGGRITSAVVLLATLVLFGALGVVGGLALFRSDAGAETTENASEGPTVQMRGPAQDPNALDEPQGAVSDPAALDRVSGPTDCPTSAAVFVCIDSLRSVGGVLEAEYRASETLRIPRQGELTSFAVFSFDTTELPEVWNRFDPPTDGATRFDATSTEPRADGLVQGVFVLRTDGRDGPLTLDQAPPDAGALCVTAYVPVDTRAPASGNCHPFPALE